MKNIINKIKLVWKGREIATNLLQLKSKWKSISFWVAMIGNLLSLIASLKGMIPPEMAAVVIVVNAILTSAYNYLRGIAKAETDGVKPFKTSSEFVMSLLTTANNAIIDMHTGGVSTPYLAAASVFLTHAVAANRDLANMRPAETQSVGADDDPKN